MTACRGKARHLPNDVATRGDISVLAWAAAGAITGLSRNTYSATTALPRNTAT